jgi:hypothetical protein
MLCEYRSRGVGLSLVEDSARGFTGSWSIELVAAVYQFSLSSTFSEIRKLV